MDRASSSISMALPVALEQLIGLERLALLRQMALVPRDLVQHVPEARDGDHVVVLVHGFLASAGVFRPLRARLERETGAHAASFTHTPGTGIRRIARRLADLVDQIPAGARITIVGHSLGGVVARWYVQEMAGRRRIEQTISLASPFGGVGVPHLLVGADLHEQSKLLAQLRSAAHVCGVPHTSIVAQNDTVVAGVRTACLGFGDVVVLPERGHNALLFCDKTADVIIGRIRSRL
jgi:triacylglycerol esterase/lipase EstA (alpha/beta hydrolase family)